MRRSATLTTAVAALIFCGLLAGVAAGESASGGHDLTAGQYTIDTMSDQPPQTRPTINVTTEYRLTPTRPGSVAVRWRFEIPGAVGTINTSLVAGADNARASGFERTASGYRWDEDEQSTRTPTLSFTVSVNRTREVTGPVDAGGRYSFVDAGSWALIQRQMPQGIGYNYQSTSPEPTVERRGETAGPGVVGSAMVFLGEHNTVERSAHGQRFELVVPDAATLSEQRSAIFASVTAASDRLRVGDRDERVLMIAAPETVPWAIRGLQTGDSDFYVIADETVDSADNVWLHEYVHTRQEFRTSERSEWVVEASAEYYAALLTLEQERIEFDSFRAHLERGTNRRFTDVRLVEPGSWRDNGGNYLKGALVAGELDRRLRAATDSERSLQRVFEWMNRQRSISHSEFVDVVARAGGTETGAVAQRYTETTDSPTPWSRQRHEQVFGDTPAGFSYRFPAVDSGQFRVSGPYGERSYSGGLVESEALTVPVEITNVGDRAGAYDLRFSNNGEIVATRSGRLDAGASTSQSVTVAFERLGRHRLSTGDDSLTVSVREPAALVVTNLTANQTGTDRERIRVTATVLNPTTRPGAETIAIGQDGTELVGERVWLDGGETTTVATTAQLDGAGTYEFTAGNATLVLTVGDGERSGRQTTGADGTGFGLLTAVVALWLLLAYRRK